MATQTLKSAERQIGLLKRRLARLGNMRPGTLSVQYRNPAKKLTPFNQISYTLNGQSRSEYVRPENLAAVSREIGNYRTFKSIVSELLALCIRASKLRCATRPHPNPSPARSPRT